MVLPKWPPVIVQLNCGDDDEGQTELLELKRWVCVRSDLKPLETDISDSSYCEVTISIFICPVITLFLVLLESLYKVRFCEVLKSWHFQIWKDTRLRGSKLGTNVGVVFGSLNPSAHWVEKCDHSSFKKDSWRLILLWLSKFSSWHKADILGKIYIVKWINK